jgi:PKD repeat protein
MPRDDEFSGAMLRPVDLVYVCGNKFLIINSDRSSIHVTYRVEGSDESGGVTLPGGQDLDEGFSETPLDTRGSGAVELYREGTRVVRRRNAGIPCGAAAMSASVAGTSSAESGSWTAPFPWPNVAVHLTLLPTGKVLSWGGYKSPQIWDPTSESFTASSSPVNVFCSGHAFLSDGRLLVTGGHLGNDRGLPDNTFFNPAAETWSRSTPMARGRWYPTATTLGNGDVLIIGGRDEASEWVYEPEVWTPGGMRVLSSADRGLPYYPRTFLAPDGRIFYAGEQVGSKFLSTSGTGQWSPGPQQLYPTPRSYGGAVMYDAGKILYAGGARTTNTAEIIDLNAAAPTWEWTGSMAYPRRHLNATVLPTGEVLVTGGTSGTGFNDHSLAVRAAEIWNPATGTWRTLASNTVPRTYHSTSVLLPDGRVLHAGSGSASSAPDEENAELFSPPYLFRSQRPTITDVPSGVGYGTSFTISTPEVDNIRKVSLIRLGSTTHAFDMNQRFQWLSFTRGTGSLTVSAPTSRNRTPPGHYLLFILNGDDVPSKGQIIRMGSSSDPNVNSPPSADFSANCTGLTCAFVDRSTDDGALTAWSWEFGDGGTSTARNPTHSYAGAGTYKVVLTVTDDAGASGQRSASLTVTRAPFTLAATARADTIKHYVKLTWSGATSTAVDIYRNGRFLRNTANDGRETVTRVYQGAATYTFKLCEPGTSICSNEVTVRFSAIVLRASGRSDGTKQYMTLTWSGATGSTVDIYRNSKFLKNTANDGRDTNSRTYQGPATYVFKVCQAGTTIGTATCSNEATVVFQ